MNEIRLSFLRALASTTKFDLVHDSSPEPFDLFWVVIVRALLGFVYAFLAAFLCWILRSPVLAALLGTIVILIAHHIITGAPEAALPAKFRKVFFPGENPTGDLLANLTVPILILLTIMEGNAFWMPVILALGTTIGIEFSAGTEDSSERSLTANWKCWAASGAALLVFAGLPCLGNSDALRATVLRAFFLFVTAIFATQFLRNTKLRTASFPANAFLGTVLAFLFTLIANAL